MCADCQECVPKCPQSINIPQELIKVKQILGEGKSIGDVFTGLPM